MSLWKWMTRPTRRAVSYPLRFSTSGFDIVPNNVILEEERRQSFRTGRCYPTKLGDVLASRYQFVGKLGFGTTSTVWLARDLQEFRHVALKIYVRGENHDDELGNYQLISRAAPLHPGYPHVRTALEILTLQRSGGDHRCLVQRPMWDSFLDLLYRNPTHRFTEDLLKAGLKQIFLALDYLHNECKLVHTDIKADNVLQGIEDHTILDDFVSAELKNPSPRKDIDGVTVYASRSFNRPKVFGDVVLGDFGSAVSGDKERCENVQPNVYRSPEVMLRSNWSYAIDIWNVGAMASTWFYGEDPDGKGYSTRAHLAEVIGLLGPPPLHLLKRGKRTSEFFSEDGHWTADMPIQETSLEQAETYLEGTNKEEFLRLLRGMLQWRPEDRKTARELLEDPWLNS